MRAKSLLAAIVILTACAGSVHAGWHLVFEGIHTHMEFTPDAVATFTDPNNPPKPVKVAVTVYNETNIALAYKVNGQPATHEKQGGQKVNQASPGAWTRWTVGGDTDNLPTIKISLSPFGGSRLESRDAMRY